MTEQDKRYEFIMRELFPVADECSGHLIELMRCAGHINEFRRLFALISPDDSDDPERIARDLENEGAWIVLMNFSASQLREGLHLLFRFCNSPGASELLKELPKEGEATFRYLSDRVEEYKKRAGILATVLVPLRNNMFHYNGQKAMEWLAERLEDDGEPRPRTASVDPSESYFGPGVEYDQSLWTKYLIHGGTTPRLSMETLEEVWRMQLAFLDLVEGLVHVLARRAGVEPNRQFGWILEHAYGYKGKTDRPTSTQ